MNKLVLATIIVIGSIIGVISFIGSATDTASTAPTTSAVKTPAETPSPTPSPSPSPIPTPSPSPATKETPKEAAVIPAPKKETTSNCDPNYGGACVPIASDVDCAGGSGNGPAYVRGPVTIVGTDIYDLDRDHDGMGCE